MNFQDYIEILDKIDDSINLYDRKLLYSTRYNITFANGDFAKVSYNEKSLAHLLGIDTTALRSTGRFEGSSIEILEEMVNNPNKLFDMINQGHIKKEKVFSEHIDKKLRNFEKICGMKVFDIEFIVKYNKSKNYISQASNESFDDGYYIGYKDNNTISIIGFIKNENDIYYPVTNLELDNNSGKDRNFLNSLMNNQTLTTIKTLKRTIWEEDNTSTRKTFFYSPEKALEKFNLIKKYANMYNATCDTNDAGIDYIKECINLKEKVESISDILMEINSKMQKNNMINANKIEKKYGYMDDHILNIISAHNESLRKGSKSKNDDEETTTYGDLINEFNQTKEELKKMNGLFTSIEEQNKKLIEENKKLHEENDKHKEKEEAITKILKK